MAVLNDPSVSKRQDNYVFNDCEHLVDYIKTRLELQPTLLDQCSSYQLLVSIIGRSDRTFENITE
jgi:hypothetical protein